MWEVIKDIPRGRLSTRKYLRFATALLVACFLYTFATAPTAFAADASWSDDSIVFEGNTFTGPTSSNDNVSYILPDDSMLYTFLKPSSVTGDTKSKAHVIYFSPGTDPPTATSASYRTYDFNGTVFTNPSSVRKITIEPALAEATGTEKEATSCAIEGGLGWVICPATNTLAKGMDVIYGLVDGFLEVQPLATTTDSTLYRAWSMMRNFANIVFIFAFLVIIYSQITNIGLTNYSVKKMMPRIVVAAILVNTSYWICAIAVDAFNILGYSLQDLFVILRNSLAIKEADSSSLSSWESVSSFILSGGAVTAAGGIGVGLAIGAVGSVAGITGLIFLLLPLLLSLLFVVLMTFLILAARQAIITILIIIAPLAFVAYLLPNTEKWFEKWRNTFFTLLIMFPAFSLIFGGSQLAAAAIIQNANSLNIVLLGMAVQVAPLAITPLLLKLGGGVLNRFAGVVNNPTKGMFDRSKTWSKDRLGANQAAKMKRMSDNPAALRRFGASRVAHRRDQSKRKREAWKAANEGMSDAHWKNTDSYQRIQGRSLEASQLGEAGESLTQAAYNRQKLIKGRVQNRDINARLAKLDVEVTDSETTVQWENLRASQSGLNVVPAHLAVQALHARTQTGEALSVAQQLKFAQHEQQQDFAKTLKSNEFLQAKAGGISEHGADSALAAAISTERGAYGKSVEEARQIVKHFNLSSEQRQAHALGYEFSMKDSAGNRRTFTTNSIFTREAVIEDQVMTGTVDQVEQIVGLSGSSLAEFRTTISGAVAKGGLGAKTVYLGGATINEIAKGTIDSPQKLTGIIQDNIAKGKFSADKLATIDKEALASVLRAARTTNTAFMSPGEVAKLPMALAKLKAFAATALTDPELRTRISDNEEKILRQIENL